MTAGRQRTGRRGALTSSALAALALAGTVALSGCSGSGDGGSDAGGGGGGPELTVRGAYMPQPVLADMAGGFLVVKNGGDTADTLTKVTSRISDDVEIHETVDHQMQQVSSLPVPANGELALRRGGDHLMFHDLKRNPAEGDTVSVTLHFSEHDPITVDVPVKATNHTADGRTGHGGDQGHDGHDTHDGHE